MRPSNARSVCLLLAVACAGAPLLAAVCDGITPSASTDLERILVADLAAGERPIFVTSRPGDPSKLYIVTQDGKIWQKDFGTSPTTFSLYLDIDARVASGAGNDERGLLGLAFDPDFDVTKFLYVYYIAAGSGGQCGPPHPSEPNNYTVVSQFREVGGVADPGSEKCVLTIGQPETNHNGGNLLFGPDDMLYVFTGDGGGGGDVHGVCGNGQNEDDNSQCLFAPAGASCALLGKVLRINPSPLHPSAFPPQCAAGNYTVPADNPYVGEDGCDEIWATGLRNPWRNAFDPLTGDLYVADVGQVCWEEINYVPGNAGTCDDGADEEELCFSDDDCAGSSCVPGGFNFGWRIMEGNHCYTGSGCDPAASSCGTEPSCFSDRFVDPLPKQGGGVVEFSHSADGFFSITGGVVYRGCRMSAFQGSYFFGDFFEATVRALDVVGGVATNIRTFPGISGGLTGNLSSFGVDGRGEAYFVHRNSGLVYAMEPPFDDLEISGPGGTPLSLDDPWSWEDLGSTSWRTIDEYRVYRSVTDPGGPFSLDFHCIHSTGTPSWTGDPDTPLLGQLYAYVVTARSGGVETGAGGPERVLACP